MSLPTPSSNGDYYRHGRREQAKGGTPPRRWCVINPTTGNVLWEALPSGPDTKAAARKNATTCSSRYGIDALVLDRASGHFYSPETGRRVRVP